MVITGIHGTAGRRYQYTTGKGDNMDIMEFGKTVLAIFGAISVLGGGFAVIHKWISPAIKMNKRVEILEEHDRRDYDVMKKYAERDSLILEVLLTMLDSQIAGPGSNLEQLKKTREKLILYLAQK